MNHERNLYKGRSLNGSMRRALLQVTRAFNGSDEVICDVSILMEKWDGTCLTLMEDGDASENVETD